MNLGSGDYVQLLTFDVGGSHISSALFDSSSEEIGPVQSVSMEDTITPDGFMAKLSELRNGLAGRIQERADVEAIAMALPNPFDHLSGVCRYRHKLSNLYGANFRTGISTQFGIDPGNIHFVNDAEAFLLGELSHRKLMNGDYTRVIGVTLGTGIGAAFAVNGIVLKEGEGIPKGGEIWNLPWDGRIAEEVVSTRAIQRAYWQRTGETRPVYEIARLAGEHADATAAFAEFGVALGQVLAAVSGAFRPKRIIVGGSIARSSKLFLPHTRRCLPATCSVEVSALFDKAPLVGAGISYMNSREHAAAR
ncbi:MAG TPA: ROK family protein [Terriglobales bacterium]|nr:ROK family protein [Terriglobales bacterium]